MVVLASFFRLYLNLDWRISYCIIGFLMERIHLMQSVYCLMGPTACGKTALSLALAKRFPIEIISVDSAMIYSGMDIGTAKPSLAERCGVPHHLLDIRQPHQSYSVGDFCLDARRVIEGVLSRGNRPLLVGGTMMYFHALQQGMADLPKGDQAIRQQLLSEARQDGWSVLYQRLQQCDPDAAAQIHPNDCQRIQRSLEVYMITGKPISQLQREKKRLPYHFTNMAIMLGDRAILHADIAERVQRMLAQGFDEEVRRVWAHKKVVSDCQAMRSVGYRQWLQYVIGDVSKQVAVESMIVATRRLAKRQLTWLRSWPNCHHLMMEDGPLLSRLLPLF